MMVTVIVLWILCGLVAAVMFGYLNECHKTKTISVNQLIGMIVVVLLGGAALAAFIITFIVASVVHLIENYGTDPVIKWGETDEE